MYSYEDRIRAIKLYIKLGKRLRAAKRTCSKELRSPVALRSKDKLSTNVSKVQPPKAKNRPKMTSRGRLQILRCESYKVADALQNDEARLTACDSRLE